MGIDHSRLYALVNTDADAPPKTVILSKNRRVMRLANGSVVAFLYDLPVLTINPNKRRIVLDLCGRWQASVTRAQREYAEALGYTIAPSLKGGKYRATFRGQVHNPGHDSCIRIVF